MRSGLLLSLLLLVACGSDKAQEDPSAVAAPTSSAHSLADQCAELIDTINIGNEALKPVDSSVPAVDPVKGMEALDKKLAELQLADPALQKHVADYRAMNRDMIALTKELDAITPSPSASASASASANPELEARMTKVTDTELRLVRALNKLCDKAE